MLDAFAFSERGGAAPPASAVGIRRENGSGFFTVAGGEDCECIAETLAARWRSAEMSLPGQLNALTRQMKGQAALAALVIRGQQAAWRADGGMRVFFVRDGRLLPADGRRTASLAADDALVLCSQAACRLLRGEEVLIDRLKAETAAQWAELLLLRVMERLPAPPAELSLITVIIQ